MIENHSKVYILVLNWNGWPDTLECLASLFTTIYPNYQIIVVDNGSTDGSAEKISGWAVGQGLADRLVIIETKENLGYAGGNNVGLRYVLARDDYGYVWVLNNDTTVDPEALTWLVDRMKEKPGAGLCGSIVLHDHDRGKIASLGGGYFDKWLGQAVHPGADKPYEPSKSDEYLRFERKINYIEGASTLVSREFLREVGLMSEDYFLYFEEIDWATRARGRYSLAIAPKSLVYHKGGASVSKTEKSSVKNRYGKTFDHYFTKNRLLFTRKYYPYLLPIVYLSIFGYCLDRALHGAFENVWIIVRATFFDAPLMKK